MGNKLNQVIYLAKFAVKSRTGKEYRKPLLCSFKITGSCNLKCAHCPFWRDSAKNQLNSLGFENVVQILDDLYSEGVRIVIFEGGEPLLWKDEKNAKDINDVIEYAKQLFFFTGITTNGTIDIERLNPDIFFISIDGLAETHDRLRGKSFARIMRNIEKNRLHKKIIANICISSENANEIEELVKFLSDKVHGITIQFFYPYSNVGDLKLGSREKEELLNNLINLKRNGIKLLNSISCMKMMINNTWKCDDFLVISVEQDGRLSRGCYLKNKAPGVLCSDCGFTVHCEISLAYRFNIDAIRSAAGIFWG
jgi:MoaA/NifB/PqqE/SkfB family radical SAM enzyme